MRHLRATKRAHRVPIWACYHTELYGFAHVTNQMGQIEGDFEKGVADGAEESLNVIARVVCRWQGLAWP